MSYNYTGYQATLITLLAAADQQGQINLITMLPNIIDYAEQRIYRDLDLLTTLTSLTNTSTAFNRNVAVPASAIVVQSANLITPANTPPDAQNSSRNPLTRSSVEFINFSYPQSTTLGLVPSIATHFALQNNNTFSTTGSNYTALLSVPPDANYVIEFVSTVRPAPLSASNPNTFLTQFLPDLFLAASMVFAAGYQRDFGAAGQVDDANLGVTWEKQYQALKASANIEELRKKASSQDWTSMSPATEARA